MTVPATCHSGHAVLPGESYCPSCGEDLNLANQSQPQDYTAPTQGYPYPSYPAQPYGQPYQSYPGPVYPPQGYAPYAPQFYGPPNQPAVPTYYPPPGYPYVRPGYPGRAYSSPWYYAPPRPTSGLAIASLVLGLLWFWWIGSILAVVFGHIALRDTRRNGHAGSGMATAGLILGWIGVATLVVFVLAGIAST